MSVGTTYPFASEQHGGLRREIAAVLILGYLGLLAGLASAHFDPATNYELSIYAATPLTFWVGAGVAYLAFLITVLNTTRNRATFLALCLGGLATTAIAALPLIRGYHFYGHSDPMTHLGWVREIDAGLLDTTQFIYPGSHSLSVLVHQTTGFDVPFSMMFVVICFTVTYIVFVPLSLYALTENRRITVCGAFSTFLLLPINNIATQFPYFPFLLATFFSPVIFYLFIKHITVPTTPSRTLLNTSDQLPTSAVFPIAASAVLFFHPQATMDLITVLVAVVGLQLYVRRRHPDHPMADTRIMLGQAVFFVVIFYLWSSNQGAATNTVKQVYSSLEAALLGSEGGEFAQTAKSRGDSAGQIGISIYELFARIFLVSLIYCVLAVVAFGFSLRDANAFGDRDVSSVVMMLVVGGVGLTGVSALHSFGGLTSYLYRHAGFGMVIVTILGAIGVAYLGGRTVATLRVREMRRAETALRALTVCVAIAMLALSLAAVHTSPFMLNPGSHVPESEVDGYETALNQYPNVTWDDDDAVWYGSIRAGPGRYMDATLYSAPYERRLIWSGVVPNESLADLQEFYRSKNDTITRRDHYVPISRYDRERETGAYRGLRYTEAGFDAVPNQPGVHLVQNNGEVTVYYVDVSLYNETAVRTNIEADRGGP